MTLTDMSPPAARRPSARPVTGNTRVDSVGPGWFFAFALGAVFIGMLGFVGLVIGAMALGDNSSAPTANSTLNISVQEFSITGELAAPAGNVTLQIANNGSMTHNVEVRGLGLVSPDVGPGGTVALSLGQLAPGVHELFCTIPGHESSGMVTNLVVSGEGDGGEAMAMGDSSAVAGGHGGDHTPEEWAQMDMDMMESMLAYPAETEGRGNPILEPTEVLADGTKVFDLVAGITDWETEPGVVVEAWSYNGVVPGPQFDLDRGDRIQVRVVNNLPVGTDIHLSLIHISEPTRPY